jgi:trans-aconitate methyltransferase
MLDIAKKRCPEAHFSLQDMSEFSVAKPLDLITCLLYSIHYNDGIEKLKNCIVSVHQALNTNGVFCFNVVDKTKINNQLFVKHTAKQEDNSFTFSSCWHYSGNGDKQSLKLSIEKKNSKQTQVWDDEHVMVAFCFDELIDILRPYFEVHVFEHDYERLLPYGKTSGNAIFTCVKI